MWKVTKFFSVARNYLKWCFPADAGAESSALFVGNLSFKVGEDELYEFFSSAGHTPQSVPTHLEHYRYKEIEQILLQINQAYCIRPYQNVCYLIVTFINGYSF